MARSRPAICSPDSEEDRYSDSLSPDGRAGFWRIDETALHLFAHGEQSHYAFPAGWTGAVTASAGEDLNQHIWVNSGTGRFVQHARELRVAIALPLVGIAGTTYLLLAGDSGAQ